MNLKEVLEHFEVKRGPNGESGYYECFCPAHKDTHPSLLIKAGESGVQVKCQRNCRTEDVLAAVGLKMSDLFYEPRKGVTKPTAPKIFRQSLPNFRKRKSRKKRSSALWIGSTPTRMSREKPSLRSSATSRRISGSVCRTQVSAAGIGGASRVCAR